MIILFGYSFSYLQSQNFEAGVGLGFSFYQGELNDGSFKSNLAVLEPIANGWLGYQPIPYLNIQANLFYGKLSADDAFSESTGRQQRNLSFNSIVYGGELRMELNILPFDYYNDRLLAPYVFGGVGMMHFNPKTQFRGQNVELQPLGTEGQGIQGFDEKYDLWTLILPGGAGLKLRLGDNFVISGEGGYAKTFTDYLDDVGSATNAPYSIVLENNGELAADLSNKRDDFFGIEASEFDDSDFRRGTPTSDDGFIFLRMRIASHFPSLSGAGGVDCYKF